MNKNTISRVHVDKNNSGPSIIILFGRFTGGAFRMVDSKAFIRQVGQALVIDGTQWQYSEHFEGLRYSIVAFLHTSTRDLSWTDKGRLMDLGFSLPSEFMCPTPMVLMADEDDGYEYEDDDPSRYHEPHGAWGELGDELGEDIPYWDWEEEDDDDDGHGDDTAERAGLSGAG